MAINNVIGLTNSFAPRETVKIFLNCSVLLKTFNLAF